MLADQSAAHPEGPRPKSDVSDAEWIARLVETGLVRALRPTSPDPRPPRLDEVSHLTAP